MRLRSPRSPDRHRAVGNPYRPAPSREDVARPPRPSPGPTAPRRRWLALLGVVLFLGLFFGPDLVGSSHATAVPYSTFLTDVADKKVTSVEVSSTGALSGNLTGGKQFTSQAPP
jgi:FtsH Extracellular